jgi:hypothetical protein
MTKREALARLWAGIWYAYGGRITLAALALAMIAIALAVWA